MDLNKLKIIQWNIRRLFSNLESLKNIIDIFQPDIIVLQETCLAIGIKFSIKNYDLIRKDRDKRGGGVLIAIKSNLKWDKYEFNLELEIAGVILKLNEKKFIIGSIYLLMKEFAS